MNIETVKDFTEPMVSLNKGGIDVSELLSLSLLFSELWVDSIYRGAIEEKSQQNRPTNSFREKTPLKERNR
jgi:hypothetical protein